MPKLKIGDRVTITDPYWYRHGETGTVIELKQLVALVQWQTDHKQIWYDKIALTKCKQTTIP